jgi:hypothetical protein
MHPQFSTPLRHCGSCHRDLPIEQFARRFWQRTGAYKGRQERCNECRAQGRPRAPLAQRFWPKVQQSEDGCWLWTGTRDRAGYGRFHVSEEEHSKPAHRVSYELAYGPIPDGLHICHRCDNPPCVRPDHLFAGTRSENIRDAVQKGRKGRPPNMTIGEDHPQSRLTTPQVVEIRQLSQQGLTAPQIAVRYGVSPGTVLDVIRRRTWRHVV